MWDLIIMEICPESMAFSPTAKPCCGVFRPDLLRCDPVQLQHQVPDKVPRVLVHIPRKVPEGSGADTSWGSGGFQWRYLPRLQRILWGSGRFRCRDLMRFRRVLVQMLCEIPKRSDVSYGKSTYFLWHMNFYGKNAEAFKLLGIASEFITTHWYNYPTPIQRLDLTINLSLGNSLYNP